MGRGMGCPSRKDRLGCFAIIFVLGSIAGLSYGIYALVDKWEVQKSHQDWPKVAGQCTITGRAGTDTYSCNCHPCGEDSTCCDTCTFTDSVYVTSSTFSSTRKASWCGPGFKDEDRGSTLDSYIAAGSTVACWYDDDHAGGTGGSTTVKFEQCDTEVAALLAGIIILSILMCCFTACYCVGVVAIISTSDFCQDCCKGICNSAGKMGRCFGELCQCLCHSLWYLVSCQCFRSHGASFNEGQAQQPNQPGEGSLQAQVDLPPVPGGDGRVQSLFRTISKRDQADVELAQA